MSLLIWLMQVTTIFGFVPERLVVDQPILVLESPKLCLF